MSAPDNDDATPALTESEHAPTRMTYGDGGWHWFPVLVWIGVVSGLVVYAARLVIPSLARWGAP